MRTLTRFLRTPKWERSPERRASKSKTMVEMHDLNLVYANGVQALHDIELGIRRGEFIFLVGSTGSGKSSLLKLMYKELQPTTGAVVVDDQDLAEVVRRDVPRLRRKIGVVFQDFRLLPNKTAFENVAYALEITGASWREIPPKVKRALEMVDLHNKADRLPGQMSGGEQQRVAIARALINDPVLLLADEPTGNLDPDSTWDIMQILTKVNARGTTVVVATHNQQMVDTMRKRVLVMKRGHLVHDIERGAYFQNERAGAVAL